MEQAGSKLLSNVLIGCHGGWFTVGHSFHIAAGHLITECRKSYS